jgi:cytochrome c oxidase cbb3-type subunit III
MSYRLGVAVVSMLVASACGIREASPVDSPVVRPDKILDFGLLYSENCAGCHGRDGNGGLAIALGDPVYLAIANDAVIRAVAAKGVPGTAMPAFAQSSGGSLTDQQIDAIVSGIRTRWAKPNILAGETPPPYAADGPGDAARGAMVYETFCSSCHGSDGRGGKHAGSIVDPSYLALVSDQSLRSTVIAGRRDLGSPDWRGDVPAKPMTNEDVSDVVAWLAAQRLQVSARR